MDLNRDTLARIDRKLLSGLGDDETSRMVRVPVAEPVWSTWKRYCDAAGISMGRAVSGLIEWELESILGEYIEEGAGALAKRVEERLEARESRVAQRELEVDEKEERLGVWTDRLRLWEGELQALVQRIEFESKLAVRSIEVSREVGRNERCPCGSGFKYKQCHGLAGRNI